MRVIWKYPIALEDRVTLDLPGGAEIRCIEMQGDQLCVWAEVDPDAPPEPRHIAIVGTGQVVPKDGRHIGTFQMLGGKLVFHAFEVKA